ncbi:protein apnoia [Anastrepha obliqua]|uniref:protein apnoia n=1 Tax=Anastrepha obliqua TaxID=95512 RepID=UPI00240A5293|nr:protein apnoia [Anastrepha obliqua]
MVANKEFVFAILLLAALMGEALCQQVAEDNASDVAEGRTFSHHFLKRLSFAVIPGAFVIGVITTLLAALTVVSMKGLGVGVILLILAIGQMLSRAIPQVHAAAYTAPAPVPVVYSHSHTQQPVWLEKEW